MGQQNAAQIQQQQQAQQQRQQLQLQQMQQQMQQQQQQQHGGYFVSLKCSRCGRLPWSENEVWTAWRVAGNEAFCQTCGIQAAHQ